MEKVYILFFFLSEENSKLFRKRNNFFVGINGFIEKNTLKKNIYIYFFGIC